MSDSRGNFGDAAPRRIPPVASSSVSILNGLRVVKSSLQLRMTSTFADKVRSPIVLHSRKGIRFKSYEGPPQNPHGAPS